MYRMSRARRQEKSSWGNGIFVVFGLAAILGGYLLGTYFNETFGVFGRTASGDGPGNVGPGQVAQGDPVTINLEASSVYLLQAGVFEAQANAERLATKLGEAGYPAWVTPSAKYRVYLGSFSTKEGAKALGETVKTTMKDFGYFVTELPLGSVAPVTTTEQAKVDQGLKALALYIQEESKWWEGLHSSGQAPAVESLGTPAQQIADAVSDQKAVAKDATLTAIAGLAPLVEENRQQVAALAANPASGETRQAALQTFMDLIQAYRGIVEGTTGQ